VEEISRAVIKLLRNREMAKDLGRAGRLRVENNFAAEKMVNGMIRVYEECLSEKG
jgi:glycosyltransferase involved in cell wall biosynthesis